MFLVREVGAGSAWRGGRGTCCGGGGCTAADGGGRGDTTAKPFDYDCADKELKEGAQFDETCSNHLQETFIFNSLFDSLFVFL
jgi:hypothetical protein